MSKEESPLAQRIEAIDVTAVDGLARVRKEREVVEGRLEALEERKEKVSQAVYDRVKGDYRDRLSELEEEARPLSQEARQEYAKLEALRREVEEAEERDRLDKEEVELRHELGELDKKDFEARIKECDGRLDERRVEREKVEELRNRFLRAVRSEEELLGAAPAEPAPPQEAPAPLGEESPEATTPPEAEVSEGDGPGEVAPAPVPDVSSGADSAEEQPEATVLLSTTGTSGEVAATDWHEAATGMVPTSPGSPAEGAPDAPAPAGGDELAGATRILSRPRMVLLDGDEPGEAFFLGPKTAIIGRAAGNAIQLLEEAISRRHAEIKPGPDGFVLEDLGSENGSYVNGERVETHTLREGDVVQIGPRRLIFREA